MKWTVYIVFNVLSSVCIAQKAVVRLSVDYKTVQIGEPITITVKSNVQGQVEIDFPPEFVSGYGTMSGMEQEMNYNKGTVTTIYYLSQTGAFKDNGTYNLQAFVKNKKVYKSNIVTIKVEKQANSANEEITKKTLRQPVFGVVQRSKNKVYEGEPLILESKVYSRLNVEHIDGYNSFEVEGGADIHELESVQGLIKNRTEEQYKGINFITFSCGKQLVFPTGTGKVKIKPFEMSLQYLSGAFIEHVGFTSLSSSVEVLPLPSGAPKDFIGGVGNFDLECSLDKTTAKQGDVVILTVVVNGAGNLHNINKPVLRLPKGIIVYGDPEVDEEVDFTVFGAEGKITYKYSLQLLNAGKYELPPISISFFDPEEKQYVQVKKEAFSIEVLPTKGFVSNTVVSSDLKNSKNNELVPFMNQPEKKEEAFFQSKWFWPTFASPLFFAFIGGLFWTRKTEITSKISEKTSRRKRVSDLKQRWNEIKKLQANTPSKALFHEIETLLKSLAFLYTGNEAPLTKAELVQVMHEYNVPEASIQALQSILLCCEEARYSFADTSDLLAENMSKTDALLNDLLVD